MVVHRRWRRRLFVIINLTVVNGPFYILFSLQRATICHPDRVYAHTRDGASISVRVPTLLYTRVVNHGQQSRRTMITIRYITRLGDCGRYNNSNTNWI